MHDITKADSENEKRLIPMCNPGYFGNLNMKKSGSVYEWWNFWQIYLQRQKVKRYH